VRQPPLHSWLAGIAACLIVIASPTCAVPLAPGYSILKESRQVRFVPGAPPRLEIRASYTLENTGTIDLKFIDVDLPEEKAFGRQNIRAELNGRAVQVESVPEYGTDHRNAFRIAMEPSWTQKQRLELLIAYDFASPENSGSQITLGENDFHLGSLGWSPVLHPPKHFLSPFPKRPDRSLFTIRVPAGFLVLARGTPSGQKREGGEIEYRFLLRMSDLSPYVVAGRYVESNSKRGSGDVIFWTLEPPKESIAAVAERISAAWAVLQMDFGTLDKNIRNPNVVESPELRPHLEGEEGPAAAAFPGGVLVGPAPLASGAGGEDFIVKVTHAIAHNWFGDEMYFAPGAAIAMGEGLPEYATIVIDEAREGDAARRKRVLAYLGKYDEARKHSVEKPLALTMLTDPAEQRRMALAKAPLFYIALEDLYGEAPVRHGLKSMATLLRGQAVGYDDMRAALEMTTGKNLVEPFHIWLYEKDIPAEFRSKYAGANETHP
jgi:hypothetical protein